MLFVIPAPLREFAGDRDELKLDGAASSLAEALAILWASCPGVRDRVLTDAIAVVERLRGR